MLNNNLKKPCFSEDMTLKIISCIYLEKIKYFSHTDISLIEISYMFFLNKYGNMKSIAEKKYHQVTLFFLNISYIIYVYL